MPRKAKELSALEIRRLTRPGRWSVGGVGGLALQVTESGAKSWVLRMWVAGHQREMGLGSFPAVSLADAKEAARAQRAKLSVGTDPIEERHMATRAVAAKRELQQTFSTVADLYIEQHEASWKNPKHGAQWRATLTALPGPMSTVISRGAPRPAPRASACGASGVAVVTCPYARLVREADRNR